MRVAFRNSWTFELQNHCFEMPTAVLGFQGDLRCQNSVFSVQKRRFR